MSWHSSNTNHVIVATLEAEVETHVFQPYLIAM
jgi:hypothetical protein